MDVSRRRNKNLRPSPKKRVTFEDGFFEDPKKNLRPKEFVKRHQRKLVLLSVFAFVTYLLFAPPPRFSKEVQFWHDNSYLFKFGELDVHFQDIPNVKKKPFSFNPILLVLHGFPTSSYDWKDLIVQFHEQFGRIVIPDFVGFGFSDKPLRHEYSVMEQATMVEGLIAYLNITDVHILAHDYGDTVLQELIARSDDPSRRIGFRIHSACLTNGGIIPSHHKPVLIQKLLIYPVLRSILPYLTNRYIFNSRFSSVFAPDRHPSSKQLNDFWAIISFKRGYTVAPAILKYIAERHANEERWVGALQNTKIPLHLIYGPLDPVNTPEGFLKAFKGLVPQSTVSVLEGIGHYPQLEAPKKFAKEFIDFSKRVFKR